MSDTTSHTAIRQEALSAANRLAEARRLIAQIQPLHPCEVALLTVLMNRTAATLSTAQPHDQPKDN
jgi:hypothetical protein